MIDTFLFDLDGTLLPVDTDKMLDEYFLSLTKKLSHLFDPHFLFKSIYSASMDMINNLDPNKTNEEAFFESFLQKVNYSKEELVALFNDFYLNDYKELGKSIKANEYVKKSLEILKEKGYNIVLATNPVFPEVAILERLKWAGLVESYFSFITTYENMHFCKPHIQYYEEILKIINKKPENCYMVGNDVEEDLIAFKLGLKTFLIEDYMINRNSKEIVATQSGSYKDLYEFVFKL
ncbi:haloacid dehalogenase domain-containing protein hydrolase [Thermoanaerobacter kivui]|uniref:Haloacid dehalogenase domain-containing protein hydrolase n=2 Tax=Thermoanaerobacter kivui TaxID=2325 RepID=A0A097AQS0_THEKI|nr:HAD family hydrolase [Thermoanaerobacter kivui]AIS52153.1 haloacid dehalogenase domain-containing protein hydrolase [Thermoanaerobacter kivui]